MDYNISCLRHGMPLKMQQLGCVQCHHEHLTEICEKVRKETKREYFNKVKSQDFWDAVVTEDGPEGRAYALQTLECIQNALRRKDG
jgi:predicted nuclease of predicted toxin-antitoxin system